MSAPPEYFENAEASECCSKNDRPPVYSLDVGQLTWNAENRAENERPWNFREFPPTYSENGGVSECSRSLDSRFYDMIPTTIGRRLIQETRTSCCFFISTFILMLLVLPILCFLMYIFRHHYIDSTYLS